MEAGQYFGPSQPRRPTGDSPGIPDGQSAPADVYKGQGVDKSMLHPHSRDYLKTNCRCNCRCKECNRLSTFDSNIMHMSYKYNISHLRYSVSFSYEDFRRNPRAELQSLYSFLMGCRNHLQTLVDFSYAVGERRNPLQISAHLKVSPIRSWK